MKKFTFLLLLTCSFTFAQSYSDVENSSTEFITATSNGTIITRIDNGRNPVLTTYDVRADFDADYITTCGGTLVSEDFSGSPAGVTTCGTIISSAGDSCFPSGEIEVGFDVQASNGTDTVAITSGTIGNSINVVGANTFTEYTIINFSPNIYAAGLDIWNNSDVNTEVRVFDAGGLLLETFTLTNTVGAENFFGFIADEPISIIEIQEANDGGDLFGNLVFGDCPLLSLENNLAELVSIYPNPVSNRLNIELPSNIVVNKAIIYDILGKDTGSRLVNGAIDTSNLARGVYILNLETDSGTLTQKIVKK